MFTFVKALRQLQRLIRGKAIAFVHILLQRSKVVQLRRIGRLVLFGNGLYHQWLTRHLVDNRLRLRLVLKLAASMLKDRLAAECMHLPKVFRLKILHFEITIHNHRQNRRLYAPQAEQQVAFTILYRKEAGSIEPHHTIRLAAAFCRMIQPIKVRTRREFFKALGNRRSRQRTNPQATAWLGLALSPVQNIAKNQFALTTGIRRADDFIRRFEQALDNQQLFMCGAILP